MVVIKIQLIRDIKLLLKYQQPAERPETGRGIISRMSGVLCLNHP